MRGGEWQMKASGRATATAWTSVKESGASAKNARIGAKTKSTRRGSITTSMKTLSASSVAATGSGSMTL